MSEILDGTVGASPRFVSLFLTTLLLDFLVFMAFEWDWFLSWKPLAGSVNKDFHLFT